MVKQRIEALRNEMKNVGLTYYLMTTADPHSSEYINDFYKEREFFSGFTGSNGDLLIGLNEAWLWTDGRYFVQAEKEIENTGIHLMKMSHPDYPTLEKFLSEKINAEDAIGFDGILLSADFGKRIETIIHKKNANIIYENNITKLIWNTNSFPARPEDSHSKCWILGEEFSGEKSSLRIIKILDYMKEKGADYYFLSKLDDQMWLWNLRGNDIECNPVVYSYTFFEKNKINIFLKSETLTEEINDYFIKLSKELKTAYSDEIEICVKKYEDAYLYLQKVSNLEQSKQSRIAIDLRSTSYAIMKQCENFGKILIVQNPTEDWKAVKNQIEIEKIKKTYLLDSLAVTRFIHYIKEHGINKTECEAAEYLDNLRKEIDGYIELSFPTISAFGSNAAMMHYEAIPGHAAVIEPNGILLVDSGGQYLGGTTDVTRSIVFGQLDNEIRKQYTHVCEGMLRLMNAKFLKGCTGRNLDILAREPMWELSMDYKCGTGHGIGYVLNVHEGPQNISWQNRKGRTEVPIVPGMLVSDEPGVYVAGSHGIRLETILLCTEHSKTSDGEFLKFEPLTFVPIDLDGIDPMEMEAKDLKWLNEYHRKVYEKLSPFMNEEECIWLQTQTREL